MDRPQLILFWIAAIFVIYQALMGWRLGLVRQLLKIGSLAAAYFGAILFADLSLPMLRLSGYPDIVLRPIGAVLIGILCYFIVAFAGRVLFKKTTDQSVGAVWFVYGISGSLLGVLFGLFFVALLAIVFRFMGTYASGVVEPHQGSTFAESPTSRKATVASLVQIRESLESGVTGSVLRTIDPVPDAAYRLAIKIGRVSANPAAITRFLTHPDAARLAARPEIASLRDDPAIARALHERHYLSLLAHPSVIKAARSPKITEIIRGFDLEAALDHAMAEPAAPPPSEP